MKISVAMATCNGEAFILEQLESLASQTRPPDELIVVDDQSNDQTIHLVEQWAAESLIRTKISVNSERLGYSGNFARAVEWCTGDVIFLCDQDDVWMPGKISRIADEFVRNPASLLVVNNQKIVDQELAPTGATSLEQLSAAGHSSRVFDLGCCQAARRELLELALPMPHEIVAHDTWLNRIALALGRRMLVRQPLQLYRRHDASVTGVDKLAVSSIRPATLGAELRRGTVDERLTGYRQLLMVLEVLLQRILQRSGWIAENVVPPVSISAVSQSLERERNAVERRIQLLTRGRLARQVGAVGLWIRGDYAYFRGLLSLVSDMLR